MKKLSLLLVLMSAFYAGAQGIAGTTTASGTTCTTSSPTAACVILQLNAASGAASITVGGTFSQTLQFEASGDNQLTWAAINAYPPSSSTGVSSTTAGGVWQLNVAGFTHIRVRSSAFTSGTATINLQANPASARALGATGGGGAGTPGGSTTQLQYNNGGAFGGIGGSSYNSTSGTLSLPGGVLANNRPVPTWLGQALSCFGDSITQGSVAPQTSQGFCSLIQQDVGGTYNDYGISGDMSADMARRVLTNTSPTYSHNPVTTTLIGTNEVAIYGANAGQQAIYTNTLGASLAWLGVPTTNKVYGQACTKTTGFATADNTFQAGLGVQSTTQSDVLTCAITTTLTSAPIYVWFRTFDSKAGTFTVTVDGGGSATLYGSGCGTNVSCSSSVISTSNGAVDTVVLYRTANVAAGAHTLVFTVTSATSASNIVNIQAVGAPSLPQGVGTPLILAGGVPKQMSDANSVLTAAYDVLANNESLLLNQDGLQVYAVPVRTPITAWGLGASTPTSIVLTSGGPYTLPSSTTCAGSDMYSALHPNVCGHIHLRDSYEWVMNPPGIIDSAPENVIANNIVQIDLSANTGTATTMTTKYIATKFTPASTITIGGFACRLDASGAFGNGTTNSISGNVRVDSAGLPSTSNLAIGVPIFFNNIPLSYAYQSLGPTGLSLTGGTSYWLTIAYTAAPTTSNIVTDSLASTGNGATSPDGTTWTQNNLGLNCQVYSQSGNAVQGVSANGPGVTGTSTSNYGVSAASVSGDAVHAAATNGVAVNAVSTYGRAIQGSSTNTIGAVINGCSSCVGLLGTTITGGAGTQGQATGSGVGLLGSSSTGDAVQGSSTSGFDFSAIHGQMKLVESATCVAGVASSDTICADSNDHTLSATSNNGTRQNFASTVYTTGAAYTNATTTFSSVTGLSFPVSASRNYHATCTIIWQGSATTTGPKYQWTGPASPTAVTASAVTAVTSSTYLNLTATAFSSALANTGTVTATTNFVDTVTVGVLNGVTAGTVQLQAAANGVGTLTIQPGSYCTVQ